MELALARVHSGAKLETDPACACDDRLGAANRPGRPVEGGKEAVACRVLLLAPEAGELPPHQGVMLSEELTPRAVAELGGALRRADDVGEEQCGENRVRHRGWDFSRDESLELVADLR